MERRKRRTKTVSQDCTALAPVPVQGAPRTAAEMKLLAAPSELLTREQQARGTDHVSCTYRYMLTRHDTHIGKMTDVDAIYKCRTVAFLIQAIK